MVKISLEKWVELWIHHVSKLPSSYALVQDAFTNEILRAQKEYFKLLSEDKQINHTRAIYELSVTSSRMTQNYGSYTNPTESRKKDHLRHLQELWDSIDFLKK